MINILQYLQSKEQAEYIMYINSVKTDKYS